MVKKFDWNTIQESNEVFLKEGSIIKLKFLDNEVEQDSVIINDKETDKFNFDVLNMDTDKEKVLGVISNPLMNELKKHQPLANKELSIRKYRVGSTDFDIEYEVIHLNP